MFAVSSLGAMTFKVLIRQIKGQYYTYNCGMKAISENFLRA